MRRFFRYVLCLITYTFFLSSCDKVKEPYVKTNSSSSGCPVPVFPAQTPVRKVLVEDYTGHRCVNCPPAGVTLENLRTTYPQQVIGLGVHANFWAKPSPCMSKPAGA